MTKTVKSNTAHFLAETAQVDAAAVAPLPGSRKVYVEGSRPDIRVPFREITLSPTRTSGVDEQNPPLLVYDTSGPYTDPSATSAHVRPSARQASAEPFRKSLPNHSSCDQFGTIPFPS